MIKKKEKNKKEMSKKVDKFNFVIKVILYFVLIFIFYEVYLYLVILKKYLYWENFFKVNVIECVIFYDYILFCLERVF